MLTTREAELALRWPDFMASLGYTYLIIFPMTAFMVIPIINQRQCIVFCWLGGFSCTFWAYYRWVALGWLGKTFNSHACCRAFMIAWGAVISILPAFGTLWLWRMGLMVPHLGEILAVLAWVVTYGIYLVGLHGIGVLSPEWDYCQFGTNRDRRERSLTLNNEPSYDTVMDLSMHSWWSLNPVYVLKSFHAHRDSKHWNRHRCYTHEDTRVWPIGYRKTYTEYCRPYRIPSQIWDSYKDFFMSFRESSVRQQLSTGSYSTTGHRLIAELHEFDMFRDLYAAFCHLDSNGDGYLSHKEFEPHKKDFIRCALHHYKFGDEHELYADMLAEMMERSFQTMPREANPGLWKRVRKKVCRRKDPTRVPPKFIIFREVVQCIQEVRKRKRDIDESVNSSFVLPPDVIGILNCIFDENKTEGENGEGVLEAAGTWKAYKQLLDKLLESGNMTRDQDATYRKKYRQWSKQILPTGEETVDRATFERSLLDGPLLVVRRPCARGCGFEARRNALTCCAICCGKADGGGSGPSLAHSSTCRRIVFDPDPGGAGGAGARRQPKNSLRGRVPYQDFFTTEGECLLTKTRPG